MRERDRLVAAVAAGESFAHEPFEVRGAGDPVGQRRAREVDQLVAYPILRLGDRGLLVRPLVGALEAAMIETCARLGVDGIRRDGHPGCWIDGGPGRPFRKIGALGLRIERGRHPVVEAVREMTGA